MMCSKNDEVLCKWLEECAGRVAEVCDVGVENGTGFDKCHDILKTVVDTWSNIIVIPFRGGPGESLENAEVVLASTCSRCLFGLKVLLRLYHNKVRKFAEQLR